MAVPKRRTSRAKRRLKESFCPSSRRWRSQVLTRAFDLVERTLKGLQDRAKKVD